MSVRDLSFAYGPTDAVSGVSLAVPAGKLLAVLGPSGCGKSTLLKLLGGYLAPRRGSVHLHDRDVTSLPPERRNAGFVFQNYALFPHLSAEANVAFGLEARGVARAERRRRVAAALGRVGLTPAEAARKPAALSGGQQQRAALARALVIEPDVLLLDEPFANLDRRLGVQLRGDLRRLHVEAGVTAVVVTHDAEEAMAVSDLVAVMDRGRVLQVGPPADVYRRPRTPFVAAAMGAVNLVEGDAVGLPPGPRYLVRPEALSFSTGEGLPGRVVSAAFGGASTRYGVATANGLLLSIVAPSGRAVGDAVAVLVRRGAAWPIPDADEP